MLSKCEKPNCRFRGWHLTRKRAAAHSAQHANRSPTGWAATPSRYLELQKLTKQKAESAAALEQSRADYFQHQPSNPCEEKLNGVGEMQLFLLNDDQLKVLDVLVSFEFYKLNHMLRSGSKFERTDGLEDAGFGSFQELAQEAATVMEFLGQNLNLPQSFTMWRGVTDSSIYGPYLTDSRVTDPGYLFAAPTYREAKNHACHHYGLWGAGKKVILKLRVCRGLYIPDPKQRSPELTDKIRPHKYLSGANRQFVAPVGTTWDVRRKDLARNPQRIDLVQRHSDQNPPL